MKLFFITFICFSFFQTKSQTVQILTDSMPVAGKLSYNLYEKSKLLSKGNGGMVYALPQDNMPALQPDTTVFYNMPVHRFKQSNYRFYPSQPQQQFQPHHFKLNGEWKDTIIQTPNGKQLMWKRIVPAPPKK